MKEEGSGVLAVVVRVVDAAVALVFVSPLVVAYWRGCWQLMDQVLFPGNLPVSVYCSIFIGIVPHLIFCIFQKFFGKLCDDCVPRVVFLVVSRFYTVLFSVACVNHWRGVWSLWDMFTGTSWQSGLLSFGLGFCLLVITSAVCNILAPPFVSYADKHQDYFKVPTLFNPNVQTRGMGVRLWLVDCAFTVVVVDSVVVFVWRGAWVMLDCFLYPGNPQLSAISSLVIGSCACVVALLTQPLLNCALMPVRHLWAKVTLELGFYAFCFCATVNIWRGVWKCLDQFFLPNDRLISNLVTAAIGQTALLLFSCGNSNLVRGAVPDVREVGKPGVVFSISYLSHFWQKYSEKKPRLDDLWTVAAEVPEAIKNMDGRCNGGLSNDCSNQDADMSRDVTRENKLTCNYDVTVALATDKSHVKQNNDSRVVLSLESLPSSDRNCGGKVTVS